MIIEAGQVAVVTGAAQGLGHALAAGFIDRGVSVVLADTATERLHSTAEAFTARDARVLPVIIDVSGPAVVAWRLHRAWANSELIIDENEGHGGESMVQSWCLANSRHADRLDTARA